MILRNGSKAVRLRNTLHTRGFFINEIEGSLTLAMGSHPSDLKDLMEIFNECNIDYEFEDERFLIIHDNVDESTLNKVLWYPAKHEGLGGVGYKSWKYFIKGRYGPKIRTIALETGVALFVKSLSAAGISITLSCDGHGQRTPVISFNGRYNASWFMMLLDAHLMKQSFNYEWKLTRTEYPNVDLTAIQKHHGWNLELVLEDTIKIACFFLDNSESISQLKNNIFGSNRNSTSKHLKHKSFYEVNEWMKFRYDEYVEKHPEIKMKERG